MPAPAHSNTARTFLRIRAGCSFRLFEKRTLLAAWTRGQNEKDIPAGLALCE
jgi:hypothetical protein